MSKDHDSKKDEEKILKDIDKISTEAQPRSEVSQRSMIAMELTQNQNMPIQTRRQSPVAPPSPAVVPGPIAPMSRSVSPLPNIASPSETIRQELRTKYQATQVIKIKSFSHVSIFEHFKSVIIFLEKTKPTFLNQQAVDCIINAFAATATPVQAERIHQNVIDNISNINNFKNLATTLRDGVVKSIFFPSYLRENVTTQMRVFQYNFQPNTTSNESKYEPQESKESQGSKGSSQRQNDTSQRYSTLFRYQEIIQKLDKCIELVNNYNFGNQ